jgi:hypothetical protein
MLSDKDGVGISLEFGQQFRGLRFKVVTSSVRMEWHYSITSLDSILAFYVCNYGFAPGQLLINWS